MALLPHNYFPRSKFDMDQWFHPHHSGHSTLDLFDPFDELDHMMSRNMEWLNKPEFLQMPMLPRVPQKYRITVDCLGYKPKSIKTDVIGHKLIVSGREEVRHEGEDYSVKEFKKTYDLPPHAEADKLVSFMTNEGQLVIEVPLKETSIHKNEDLFPRIVDKEDGKKMVQLKFSLPEGIHPEKISVNVKDRDLIVKAEDKIEKPDGISRFHYYKRTTLPENTDFSALKCNYDNHKLAIEAPLDLNYKPVKRVPIEHKKQQPAVTHK